MLVSPTTNIFYSDKDGLEGQVHEPDDHLDEGHETDSYEESKSSTC